MTEFYDTYVTLLADEVEDIIAIKGSCVLDVKAEIFPGDVYTAKAMQILLCHVNGKKIGLEPVDILPFLGYDAIRAIELMVSKEEQR